MAVEGIFDKLKDTEPMLESGADNGGGIGIVTSAAEGTETAGDFLFYLDIPDIPLGLIIVERHVEVGGKEDDFSTILPQTDAQIFSFGFLADV